MYRHGDVLIAAVDEIPASALPRKSRVLAKGEVTGHSHRFEPADSACLFQQGDDLFLRVTAEHTTLVHEEHGPIQVPEGDYRVWRQREYTPEAIRTVVD